MRGPSALGGGWRRSADLLLLIAAQDFRRTYFGTRLGYLWSIARPLLLFAVLLEVFTHAFHLGSQVPHYPVVLLLGLVLFGFFQDATGVAVTSIVAQESVMRKTQFPRLVIPLSVVLTALFNLGPNLVVALGFALALGVTPALTWLLLIPIVAVLFLITVAVAMILSSLYPSFRDLGLVWTVLATALFYATPVIYPLENVSRPARTILSMNPLAPLLELARRWVVDPHAPTPAALAGGGLRLLIPLTLAAALGAAAVLIFRRQAPRIAELL